MTRVALFKLKENMMRIIPMGDYYVWYCEWCDSRNQTLWARLEGGSVTCAACQQRFTVFAGQPPFRHGKSTRAGLQGM